MAIVHKVPAVKVSINLEEGDHISSRRDLIVPHTLLAAPIETPTVCPIGFHLNSDGICVRDGHFPLRDREFFRFTIEVHGTGSFDREFSIPVSNPFPYNWTINWGDGSTVHRTGTGSGAGFGISRVYQRPGRYTITIRPAGGLNGWFRAFGFRPNTLAEDERHKQMVLSLDSPLTVAMFAPLDSTSVSNDVCHNLFYECGGIGFHLGPQFGFSPEWHTVTSTGNNFGRNMFYGCTNLVTSSTIFTLPQGLNVVGHGFGMGMFEECTNLTALFDSFRMPTVLTGVGNDFASGMFANCVRLGVIPNDFNLPQLVNSVGSNFARSMFMHCSHRNFRISNSFRFPQLASQPGAFFRTFFASRQVIPAILQPQPLAAVTIIGNQTGTPGRETFRSIIDGVDYTATRWGIVPNNWA
jgi:hypothetical protein